MATTPIRPKSGVPTPEQMAQAQLEQLKQISSGISAIATQLHQLHLALDSISHKLSK
jgi:hypothetical protein